MKTTTDNHIDKLLHEAMKRRADKVPPLAEDFAEKVMGSLIPNSLTPRPLQRKREQKRRVFPLSWRGIGGGLIAASIVLLLAFHFTRKPVEEQSLVAEVIEQPVVAQQTEKQEEPVIKEEPPEAITEVEAPARPRRTPKHRRVVQQEVIEEPLLAEAEAVEKVPTENVYHEAPREADPFLAVADQIQDIRSRGERLGREIAQLTDNKIKYQ